MAQFRGLEQLADVIDLIKNPAKYEQKLQEIQNSVKAYTEVVEAVVKLSEVNDYTNSIRAREEETKAVLAQAKADAESVKAAAREFAQTSKQKQKEKEADLDAAIQINKAKQAELDTERKTLESLKEKYKILIAEQEKALAEARAAEKEFVELKSKLLSIVM